MKPLQPQLFALRCVARWVACAGIGALITVAAQAAQPLTTPVGLWRSFDDDNGQPLAEIRIKEDAQGTLTGVIEKVLAPEGDTICALCPGDRKDKHALGLEIIRDEHHVDGKDLWEGGTILDPDNGKLYTLRMVPIEGGKKLQVRGYIGPFYRTQIWVRME